jgi:hypothetical protein
MLFINKFMNVLKYKYIFCDDFFVMYSIFFIVLIIDLIHNALISTLYFSLHYIMLKLLSKTKIKIS